MKHDWNILYDTTTNGVPPYRLKSRKPYNKEAQEILSGIPEDQSKDSWIAATWKQEWEASGTLPSSPPCIEPRRRHQLRRSELKTLDDSTANWGRSVQSIREEVGIGGQCECEQNRQLTTSSTAAHYIDHHPNLASSKFGPLAITWLQQTELTI